MAEKHLSFIEGLIISRQQLETARGIDLILWLATESGPCKLVISDQRYVLLVVQEDLQQVQALCSKQQLAVHECRVLPLKTFKQQSVAAIYSLSKQHSHALQRALDSAAIPYFEADIQISDRYLMERFIYGCVKVRGNIQWAGRYWLCQSPKLSPGNVSPALKSVSLDVECSPLGELYSIALSYGNATGKAAAPEIAAYSIVLMIGSAQPAPDINIQWVKDEPGLLNALQAWFTEHDPDAISGWAVGNFDLRLLAKRAQAHHMQLLIGRDGSSLRWIASANEPQQGVAIVNGRAVLDGIEQLKNASWQFDSFSLEFVSQSLLGQGKLIGTEHNKGLEIQRLFEQDPLSLARYNLQDCLLVEKIFNKAQLLEYTTQRARLTGLALDRRGASVAAFTNLYLPLLHRSGYVAPNIGDIKAQLSPGGFVMESRPGLYSWVLLLDFKSLYPSIIRTFKIDPMGLIEGLAETESDSICGFRGARFSRSKHHLPGILDTLSAARDRAKREDNQPFQHAIKIIMNSMYGVLGSKGCRFHDTRLASSITLRGHQIMKETRDFIEQAGEQVIYGDTDSTFIWLQSCLTAEDAQMRGEKLEKQINDYWAERLKNEFQLDCFLEIEFETCFRKFFLPTLRGSEIGSKKRYVGLKQTAAGEQLLFKGLETVRSDWTELAQTFQHALYSKVFAAEPIDRLIIDTVSQLNAGLLDQKLTYHKRLRRPLAAYLKNVPPQVRAARLADLNNARLGRPLRYQQRGRIAYLITLNGPQAEEYLESAIDYQHYIDKQLKPIAEAILPLLGKNFAQLISDQLSLF